MHYVPHLAVTHVDKETTQLFAVYDASARGDGRLLNDCPYSSSKFDLRIMDILLRLQTHKVSLVADIEKAFLQISIAKKDRNALRFFWVDDATKPNPEIITLCFTRVPFGVTSSPFLLIATMAVFINAPLIRNSVRNIQPSPN